MPDDTQGGRDFDTVATREHFAMDSVDLASSATSNDYEEHAMALFKKEMDPLNVSGDKLRGIAGAARELK